MARTADRRKSTAPLLVKNGEPRHEGCSTALKQLGFSIFADDAEPAPDQTVGISDGGVVSRAQLLRQVAVVARWMLDQPDASDVTVAVKTRLHAWVALLSCLTVGRKARLIPFGQLDSLAHAHRPLLVSRSADSEPTPTRPTLELDALAAAAPDSAFAAFPPLEPHRGVVTLLSSGTTGEPVEHTKTAEQLWSEVDVLQRELGWNEHDVVVATVPSHHLYGLLFTVLLPLRSGAPLVLQRAVEPELFHPLALARVVQSTRATRLVTVPAHLRLLLEAEVELPGLRQVICSAATLEPRWAREFEKRFGAEVIDVLGSTETGGLAVRRAAVDTPYRPLPQVRLHVDDDEQLWVNSPFAGNGAVDAPPLRTGDRARVIASGQIEHLGRDDGVVKVGGKRVSLQEVESCAKRVPGVRDAVARAKSVLGLRGTDIWLLVEASGVSSRDLKERLRDELDPVFVPRRIRIVDRFPLSVRGKLESARFDEIFDPSLATQLLGSTAVSNDAFSVTLMIPRSSERFDGHFPGDAVFPGVAQLTDLVLPAVRKHLPQLRITRWTRLKFTARILPGARVTLLVQRVAQGKWRFEISEGQALCCSGILHAAE